VPDGETNGNRGRPSPAAGSFPSLHISCRSSMPCNFLCLSSTGGC